MRLDEAGLARAAALTQLNGLPDLLARVLASRNVDPATASDYLDPTLRRLMPDPDRLQDMPAAVERLARAVARRDCVAIIGDYDVDGAASAALLADYLEACGLDCRIHIPDRLLEGYGPSVAAVEHLAGQGAGLLVTVDCGSSGGAAFEAAARRGLDCVVLDHHQMGAALPAVAALVNPNRPDDLSGLGHLCAAGVVFMTLVALNRALKARGFWTDRPAPDLLAGLDLVALATVADVVPLAGLNRAFVAKGLAVARRRGRPGLAALFDVAGSEGPPSAFQFGYLIGPRINAGGRIGDAGLGTRLLRLRDPIEAARLAAELDRLNRDRRTLEAAAVEEAEAEALLAVSRAADSPVLVAAGEGWHAGVVGLVAARLRERFERPAFAIALAGGVGTGSGRSVPGIDLGRAVRDALDAGLVQRGGGHAMAAGVTIAATRLDAFRAFLCGRFAADMARLGAVSALLIDATLSAAAASADLLAELDKAGPFGAASPEPVVALPAHRLLDCATVGENHLRMTLAAQDGTRLRAVAFRAGASPLGQGLTAAQGQRLHVAGSLSLNRWGGRAPRVELRVLDAAPADVSMG